MVKRRQLVLPLMKKWNIRIIFKNIVDKYWFIFLSFFCSNSVLDFLWNLSKHAKDGGNSLTNH